MTLEVEQVLGRTERQIDDRVVHIELFLHAEDVLGELMANQTSERAIFALHRKQDDPRFFRLVNDHQGLIREFDGRAHVTSGETLSFAHLEGQPFDDVIEQLRSSRGD